MVDFSTMTELELVEAYISSEFDNETSYNFFDEQSLSDAFDAEIAEHVIDQYGEDDEPAMNEAFSDWTDSLCKDGRLHSVQYSNYCYVGKYS
jgi:hypothetical protein